jgi:hypothetical protein
MTRGNHREDDPRQSSWRRRTRAEAIIATTRGNHPDPAGVHYSATESYRIYSPVDAVAMNVVLNGSDLDYMALLPSGFAILPDGGHRGSLLTIALKILVNSITAAKLSLGSVATVNCLIACAPSSVDEKKHQN